MDLLNFAQVLQAAASICLGHRWRLRCTGDVDVECDMVHVNVENSVDRAEIKHRPPQGLDQNGTWSRMLEHGSSKR